MSRLVMDRSGEMEVFARVVQEGGFSAAARSLQLTPSAVSKLIARLEDRLGVRLLVRTTRALTLTEEGTAYHQATLRILEQMDGIDQAVAAGQVKGRLAINASVPFGSLFVAPAIPAFLTRYPHISVEFSVSDDMVDLASGKADIAIRTGDLPDSTLVARKLVTGRRVLCAAPAYLERMGTPGQPEDLARHECLKFTFRPPGYRWPFTRDGQPFGLPVSGSLLVNNGETMKLLALAGAGIARLGLFHIREEIAQGRLIPLLEPFDAAEQEDVSAVYVGGGPIPARVRAFIDHLLGHLNGHPAFRPL